MEIIIADEQDTIGYVCYKTQSDIKGIYVLLWAATKTIKIYYHSQEALINEMKMFVGSPLTEHSEIHKAKEFMGLAFLETVSAKRKMHPVVDRIFR
jgi:hypothetical protein